TRDFFAQHKPVAVICHGGWILTDADVVRGRTLTSYPSLRTDLTNAGATWVDEEVVVDRGLVSSRTPDDLPAFNAKLVEELAEGPHGGRTACLPRPRGRAGRPGRARPRRRPGRPPRTSHLAGDVPGGGSRRVVPEAEPRRRAGRPAARMQQEGTTDG